MELRDIKIFLALSEELHFGRAARRLHLSQGRVSQSIRSLEREVGGRSFDRTESACTTYTYWHTVRRRRPVRLWRAHPNGPGLPGDGARQPRSVAYRIFRNDRRRLRRRSGASVRETAP